MGSVSTPVKVLQNIIRKEISGRLTLSDPDQKNGFWHLHIGKGQLHYATSTEGGRERLLYCLGQDAPELLTQIPIPNVLPSTEYDWLRDLWKQGNLPLADLRNALKILSRDAMTQILSLRTASFQFERQIGLSSILIYQDFRAVILPIADRVREWQKLQPRMVSGLQRVCLKQPQLLTPDRLDRFTLSCPLPPSLNLAETLSKNPSLYSLAYQFKADLLTVAQAIQPLVLEGVIDLYDYCWEDHKKRPKVACIDDSSTVQRNVKLILEASGFQVVGITQPLMALSSLGRDAPDLILLDINMPDLDGYTLCRMLRQCTALKETPIVMLTGRDALIDKVKARILGASDYMTKPFTPTVLVDLVNQYLKIEA